MHAQLDNTDKTKLQSTTPLEVPHECLAFQVHLCDLPYDSQPETIREQQKGVTVG